MTHEEIEAIRKRHEERENLFAYDCEYNHDELDRDLDTLLAEIRQMRLEIASILNDAGCTPASGLGSGQGPGVLPPWTYRRLDDLLKGE